MAQRDFSGSSPKASAVEFATRTVHAPDGKSDSPSPDKSDEVAQTIAELAQYFGTAAIAQACVDLGITASQEQVNERTLQSLRAFAVLILDSSRPKLTVQLVGKLAGIEIATGKRLRLVDLATAEGISKQAVSRLLATYAERLNLPRPDSTPEARASHRAMNRRNYGHSQAHATHARH
jgi:hypothetical protein